VIRGGSWYFEDPYDYRTSYRAKGKPSDKINFCGFRCCSGASSAPAVKPDEPMATPKRPVMPLKPVEPTPVTAAFNPSKTYGAETDIDGNVYRTITIGAQTWMAENLRTTKYCNGDPIPEVTDTTAWTNVNTGAYCNYDNARDAKTIATYGRLYNWHAVVDSRNICPTGWHVSTDAEWETLTDYVGGAGVAGDKLKEAGTTRWAKPNTGANNEAAFTALPGGHRYQDEPFKYLGLSGNWWSVAGHHTDGDWYRYMVCNGSAVTRNFSGKHSGFSVRCVKD
jgi:uncharacterized protein (TIGR02145 family)